jgi:hypothetical protein
MAPSGRCTAIVCVLMVGFSPMGPEFSVGGQHIEDSGRMVVKSSDARNRCRIHGYAADAKGRTETNESLDYSEPSLVVDRFCRNPG